MAKKADKSKDSASKKKKKSKKIRNSGKDNRVEADLTGANGPKPTVPDLQGEATQNRTTPLEARGSVGDTSGAKPDEEKQQASTPSAAKKLNYKNVVLTGMLTILTGSLFGDFIIKRNINNYNQEKTAFDSVAARGGAQFEEEIAAINKRVRDRRNQIYYMSRFMHGRLIPSFEVNYPAYAQVVWDWNRDLRDVRASIMNITGCDKVMRDTPNWKKLQGYFVEAWKKTSENTQIRNVVLQKEPKLANVTRDGFLNNDNLCPSYFYVNEIEQPISSVHGKFNTMHDKIYNFHMHPHSQCSLAHLENRKNYYSLCAAEPDRKTAAACLQKMDKALSDNEYCQHIPFVMEDFVIIDKDLAEIDYYWSLGNLYLQKFKPDFMVKYCQKQIGFWGRTFGWDCEKKVASYLNPNPNPRPNPKTRAASLQSYRF